MINSTPGYINKYIQINNASIIHIATAFVASIFTRSTRYLSETHQRVNVKRGKDVMSR